MKSHVGREDLPNGQEKLWASNRALWHRVLELEHRVDLLQRVKRNDAVRQSRAKHQASSEGEDRMLTVEDLRVKGYY